MNNPKAIKKRKRGVIASRQKLEKALLQAGLKTQAALAYKIAEIENTEAVPKDLVNKVFRERPVSPSSIERVANALKVESFTLYKSHQESLAEGAASASTDSYSEIQEPTNTADEALPTEFMQRESSEKNTRLNKLLVGVFSTVIFVAVFITYSPSSDTEAASTANNIEYIDHDKLFPNSSDALGRYSLAIEVAPDSDDQSTVFRDALADSLSDKVNVLPDILFTFSPYNAFEPSSILSQTDADYVLLLESVKKGRFLYYQARLADQSNSHIIWENISTSSEFYKNRASFLSQLVLSTEQALGLTDLAIPLPQQQLSEVAKSFYLEGLMLLDDSQNQLSIKSAQSRFANTIRYAPDYGPAYAGLCESLLLESWTIQEKEAIKNAQIYCAKAIELDAKNNFVVKADAFLKRKTGMIREAIAMLHEQLAISPNSPDLNYELAYSEFQAHNQYPDNHYLLEHAKEHAQSAIKLDPQFWKAHFVLGLIEWTNGNMSEAIEATYSAYIVDANELVLTNLGVFSLCKGEISDANNYFKEAVLISPESYLGYEMLGLSFFYQRQFDKAIESRLQAIDHAGDANVHQIWGSLGDSYFEKSDYLKASQSYKRALDIIASDIALGNNEASDNVYQIYYLHRLSKIAPENESLANLYERTLLELDPVIDNVWGSEAVRLAIVFFERGEMTSGETYLKYSIDNCPLYSQHPSLASLTLGSDNSR